MKYMLLIYDDEKIWATMPEAERQKMFGEYMQFSKDVQESGHYKAGAPLQPTSKATSVKVRNGKRLVTDGPFAETREHLGGYYLIDVESDEEAARWAAKIPSARVGTIEVRKVVVFDQAPA